MERWGGWLENINQQNLELKNNNGKTTPDSVLESAEKDPYPPPPPPPPLPTADDYNRFGRKMNLTILQ